MSEPQTPGIKIYIPHPGGVKPLPKPAPESAEPEAVRIWNGSKPQR